ncbi:hypothetical protein PHLGIDRAFT_16713 [Phlebiopsis gigantea 11061_1 CR5-6]|uniref:Uncharacterized protein n=1 Tax=Phlebiopsis gigantea (strain 11061_1 CR5-6) TaxID=745531 RepID=A0A0C3PBA3_PHLG1|nr:hypothetical protein PHLGIDRAFT_16713 [Phlebiopsis gigantea 11061_1 CR5-6]
MNALDASFRGTPEYEERPPTSAPDRARLNLRFAWPEYPTWESNINVRERNAAALPVQKWLLARRIAEQFVRFRQKTIEDQTITSEYGPDKFDLNQLILYELRQISRGTWQAVIALRDNSFPN